MIKCYMFSMSDNILKTKCKALQFFKVTGYLKVQTFTKCLKTTGWHDI